MTMDPSDSYDIVHINTIFPSDYRMAKRAKRQGKKVVYHAHSTEEDFRNSFIGSNVISPLFRKWITKCYKTGDLILTPTEYSKSLLKGYGIDNEIEAISNGVDTNLFQKNEAARILFRRKYGFGAEEKLIMSVGLYFERKGILDFVSLAEQMPEYQFLWFGYTPDSQIPKKVREAVHKKLPNLHFMGYLPKEELQMAYSSCDLFFFPSYEETEGIVVLEALASSQQVLLRDIPVYDPWLLHGVNCYKGKTVADFVDLTEKIVEGKVDNLTENGRFTAESRSIECIGEKLREVYEKVLAL